MKTINQFIRENRIHMTCEWNDSNPNMDLDDWSRTATHWKCTLRRGKRQLTTYFSQGTAHTEEPTAADVLDCLASDSAGNFTSFEEWCGNYGYDPDSRKAERTFLTIKKQSGELLRFLGPDSYKALLFDTERQ